MSSECTDPAQNDAHFNRTGAYDILDESCSVVSQVSNTRAQALEKMGIYTVRDLLQSYPRRYIDFSRRSSISQAQISQTYTICANVYEVQVKHPRKNLSLVNITLVDGTGTLIVTMFNMPWLPKKVKAGYRLAVSGKVTFSYGFKRMTNPLFEIIQTENSQNAKNSNTKQNNSSVHNLGVNHSSIDVGGIGSFLSLHPACNKISQTQMRRIVANALTLTLALPDPIPISIRAKYHFMSKSTALRSIHFPRSSNEINSAKNRIAFEELLTLQLKLARDEQKKIQGKKPAKHVTQGQHQKAFVCALPFKLTHDQAGAIKEINVRLACVAHVNHLILGDVGTGKTVVAGALMSAVADTHTQAIFIAPTEILAKQHFRVLGELFGKADISCELLTGSVKGSERARIIKDAKDGKIDVLIGTHALLQDDVVLPSCSLVVIDEQHRFGVDQRQTLIEKGECPDVISMSATPIPRTLALATMGNITMSYLKEKPHASRRTTRLIHYHARGQAYEAALEACKRGEQVFVVCPLISAISSSSVQNSGQNERAEKSAGGAKSAQGTKSAAHANPENEENLLQEEYIYGAISIQSYDDYKLGATTANITAAEKHAKFLQSKVFVDFNVGLLHGRMNDEESQDVMEKFRAGDIDVLVSTTVIEVGVDVPRATILIVEDADRFGLAQLHQLRGRVGRGDADAQVFLISRTTNEDARARLQAMEKTDDGIELAKFDLELRREGDILGNRQHGTSSLKVVNIMRDEELVEMAHKEASAIIEVDPLLTLPEHAQLSHACDLLDVEH